MDVLVTMVGAMAYTVDRLRCSGPTDVEIDEVDISVVWYLVTDDSR